MESTRTEYTHRVEWANEQGQLHREDGPAIEYANGDTEWFLNGEYHRVDGPAIELLNGGKYWYLNGERHREDGPALEWSDGYKSWYLNGKCYSEQDYNEEMLNIRLNRLMEL